jgi:hypothetical protein
MDKHKSVDVLRGYVLPQVEGIALRRGIVTEAMLYAFDLLEFGGEDLRPYEIRRRS